MSQRLSRQEYEARLGRVRLLVTDVDGVLTDGGIAYLEHEEEAKVFHVRDGSGFYIARRIDLPVLVVTARKSRAVARRFEELPVMELCQGTFDKLSACRQAQERLGIEPQRVAYLGDDLVDLPAMRWAGLAIAVADAHPRVLAEAQWQTRLAGGRGAFREVVDDIVTARGLWQHVLQDYEERQGQDAGA